jgi:hypothetical protein
MSSERQKLLSNYYYNHRQNLNLRMLRIAFIYLLLSIVWNTLFYTFQLPLTRASLGTLICAMIVLLVILFANRKFSIPPAVMQHVVLLFLVYVACSLYFGSGYKEAWGYFLTIPILAGLYGNLPILFIYSGIGLVAMLVVGTVHPLVPGVFDSIDTSNRILLYLVLGTFSYLLPRQLSRLYNNQVNIIMESMEKTVEQVVKSFVVSIEAKDSYTFGHSERVSKYAVELAARLPQFQDSRKLKALRLAGLLHDIGKINIPEPVLTKPSRLTEEEYELIKTHPVAGGRMVEKISGLGSLKSGVLYHHERWDGKGYPTGAIGEEIPLEARILGIADAFDAMTSSRSYRPALSTDEAFARLEEASGTQFDPELMKALETVKLVWLQIYEEANEDLSDFEKMTDFL